MLGMAVTKDGKRRGSLVSLVGQENFEMQHLLQSDAKVDSFNQYFVLDHCNCAFCEMQFVAIDLDQLVLTCAFDTWNGGKHFHEMA